MRLTNCYQDPYSITSVTGLLIDRIIPEGIPFKEENFREPTDDMSLAYLEFVWASLMALDKFAYWFAQTHEEDQRLYVLVKAYEERLKSEIPLALGGSNDVFSPTDIDELDEADMNFGITRVNERYWAEWCFGKSAVPLYRFGRYFDLPVLVQALDFPQLPVGRMQVIKLSLDAFLEQREQLPLTEWSILVIRGVKRNVRNIMKTLFKMYQRDNEARQIYPGYETPELMDLLPIPDASAVSLSGGAGPSRNLENSAAAHDHGLSTDDFQWLSLDTSRTMTEHGQVRTRGSRRQRSNPGSSNLECRG
ncbi:hypothetical protein SeLEV6574_g08285 [Synchytrium endobioticum]|uniref:Uncharacterized protein n=1 Tax=Synchytrium endobioticum TaxID=286115 RepID=A0A507CAA3_9FUNG|nr:hypothetical protein SeLEV6574_g08285 [Synchytrium endobioticum]